MDPASARHAALQTHDPPFEAAVALVGAFVPVGRALLWTASFDHRVRSFSSLAQVGGPFDLVVDNVRQASRGLRTRRMARLAVRGS